MLYLRQLAFIGVLVFLGTGSALAEEEGDEEDISFYAYVGAGLTQQTVGYWWGGTAFSESRGHGLALNVDAFYVLSWMELKGELDFLYSSLDVEHQKRTEPRISALRGTSMIFGVCTPSDAKICMDFSGSFSHTLKTDLGNRHEGLAENVRGPLLGLGFYGSIPVTDDVAIYAKCRKFKGSPRHFRQYGVDECVLGANLLAYVR